MSAINNSILRKMAEIISSLNASDLGSSANSLLLLRDELEFEDDAWYQEFDQNIATLDSASTFYSSDNAKTQAADKAVADAVVGLNKLIASKISG